MSRDEVIAECRRQLATNFDWPAREILSFYGSKIGLTGREMDELLRSLVSSDRPFSTGRRVRDSRTRATRRTRT